MWSTLKCRRACATSSPSLGWSLVCTATIFCTRAGSQRRICFISSAFSSAGPVIRIAPASEIAAATRCQKGLVLWCITAPDSLRFMVKMRRTMVGLNYQAVNFGRVEMEDACLVMIDPHHRMEMCRHGSLAWREPISLCGGKASIRGSTFSRSQQIRASGFIALPDFLSAGVCGPQPKYRPCALRDNANRRSASFARVSHRAH
jgi:hypothetical protein